MDTAVQTKFFTVDGELKNILDGLDKSNLRTCFSQASDPIHLAFGHIDSKPLPTVMKEFAQDAAYDFMNFITNLFS